VADAFLTSNVSTPVGDRKGARLCRSGTAAAWTALVIAWLTAACSYNPAYPDVFHCSTDQKCPTGWTKQGQGTDFRCRKPTDAATPFALDGGSRDTASHDSAGGLSADGAVGPPDAPVRTDGSGAADGPGTDGSSSPPDAPMARDANCGTGSDLCAMRAGTRCLEGTGVLLRCEPRADGCWDATMQNCAQTAQVCAQANGRAECCPVSICPPGKDVHCDGKTQISCAPPQTTNPPTVCRIEVKRTFCPDECPCEP
jgi:hypothetical protein